MKKKDCYINTEKIFEQRRVNDKLRQSMHINEVYKKIPAIEDIEQKMKNNSSEFFQFIESGENNAGRFLEYKKKSLDLQRQRAELLFENNYPIDYLNTVSYTHLDVYKRQVLCKRDRYIPQQI